VLRCQSCGRESPDGFAFCGACGAALAPEEIRLIVERHGGTVEKFIGDAARAVFGIPLAHEDDALRAVRAVAEIRERLTALGEELAVPLSFRTGVNTGDAWARELLDSLSA